MTPNGLEWKSDDSHLIKLTAWHFIQDVSVLLKYVQVENHQRAWSDGRVVSHMVTDDLLQLERWMNWELLAVGAGGVSAPRDDKAFGHVTIPGNVSRLLKPQLRLCLYRRTLIFKTAEQIRLQGTSQCFCGANIEGMLLLSVTVTPPDLSGSQQESVTWVQTGLLHYWPVAICCLEGLAEKEKGITERGLMDPLSISAVF